METRGRIARLREFGCEDPVLDATLEEMAIAMELGLHPPGQALGITRAKGRPKGWRKYKPRAV